MNAIVNTIDLSLFAYLPDELKEIILEFDPNRRTLLNDLCNELRLAVPYWFRMHGIVPALAYADRALKNVMDNKVMCVWDISLAAGCDHCGEIKSSKLMLCYIKHVSVEHSFGLWCNNCISTF
jgi:hypothetical protein